MISFTKSFDLSLKLSNSMFVFIYKTFSFSFKVMNQSAFLVIPSFSGFVHFSLFVAQNIRDSLISIILELSKLHLMSLEIGSLDAQAFIKSLNLYSQILIGGFLISQSVSQVILKNVISCFSELQRNVNQVLKKIVFNNLEISFTSSLNIQNAKESKKKEINE